MNTNFQLIYLKLWFNEFLPVSMLEWNSFLLKIKYILISSNFLAGICLLVLRKYHVKNLFFSQISYKYRSINKKNSEKNWPAVHSFKRWKCWIFFKISSFTILKISKPYNIEDFNFDVDFLQIFYREDIIKFCQSNFCQPPSCISKKIKNVFC